MARSVGRSQSAFRAPLNAVLGKETHVRVLRALSGVRAPVGPGELAARAELEPLSVRRALARLVETGVVERVGIGARPQYQLRRAHPLAPALEALFAAERARSEAVFRAVCAALSVVRPPPVAAWVSGEGERGHDDVLRVFVLLRAGPVSEARALLHEALAEVERGEDVTVELLLHTPADVEAFSPSERARLALARPLFGLPPSAILSPGGEASGGGARGHAEHDEAARALAVEIGARIARDPSLVARAREWIARRLEEASPREREDLLEWEHVLSTMTVPRLRRFLADPGERATRLRQSLPFASALEPAERDALLAALRR